MKLTGYCVKCGRKRCFSEDYWWMFYEWFYTRPTYRPWIWDDEEVPFCCKQDNFIIDSSCRLNRINERLTPWLLLPNVIKNKHGLFVFNEILVTSQFGGRGIDFAIIEGDTIKYYIERWNKKSYPSYEPNLKELDSQSLVLEMKKPYLEISIEELEQKKISELIKREGIKDYKYRTVMLCILITIKSEIKKGRKLKK